jgi:hypothetical protein
LSWNYSHFFNTNAYLHVKEEKLYSFMNIMYVCTHINVLKCDYTYICIFYTNLIGNPPVCMNMYIYTCIRTYRFKYIYIYIYIYMYTYIYICIYVYRVIHIYDVYEHEYIGNPPAHLGYLLLLCRIHFTYFYVYIYVYTMYMYTNICT